MIHPERTAPDQIQANSSSGGSDVALVAAVLRKDRKATAEFVALYADQLYAYLRSRLAPRYDQADDLVQEVFLAAWESLSQYRGTGSLRAWIMGIARHKVEDYYRRRLRDPDSLEETELDPEAPTPVLDFPQALERDQLREHTLLVLQGLPERYRLVLLWRYWETASARDMALKTGKTEKAIERLLARARAEFRQRWNRGQSA